MSVPAANVSQNDIKGGDNVLSRKSVVLFAQDSERVMQLLLDVIEKRRNVSHSHFSHSVKDVSEVLTRLLRDGDPPIVAMDGCRESSVTLLPGQTDSYTKRLKAILNSVFGPHQTLLTEPTVVDKDGSAESLSQADCAFKITIQSSVEDPTLRQIRCYTMRFTQVTEQNSRWPIFSSLLGGRLFDNRRVECEWLIFSGSYRFSKTQQLCDQLQQLFDDTVTRSDEGEQK